MTVDTLHSEHPPGSPDDRTKRELQQRKRKQVLIAAVSGTTALIVIVWALLLPGQLKDMSHFGQSGREGLQQIRDQAQGSAATFSASLDATGKELQQIEAAQNTNTVSGTNTPILSTDQVNALRTKIESNGQTADTNANATNK